MSKRYIYTLAACGPHIPCGQKARNLAFLRVHRFRVPKTYVCVWDAFDQSVQNRDALKKQLQHEIAGIIRPGKAYAVRSSSNLEDGKAFSHAGIFATVLNVQGIDAVLDAVNAIRDSTRSARVSAYLRKAALEGSR
ncbi:MAG: hypothetical protein NTX06_10945, partial [Proteobacteria bacterium]|nr:hypothetical protein [Pseudomonadota bacterium]